MANVNKPGDLAGLFMGIADILAPKHLTPDLHVTYQVGRPFVEQAAKELARGVKRNPVLMQVLNRVAELHAQGAEQEAAEARTREEAARRVAAEQAEVERLRKVAADARFDTPVRDVPPSAETRSFRAKPNRDDWGKY